VTSGFQHALVACSIFLVAGAVIASRATNVKHQPAPSIEPVPDPAAVPESVQ
jgi:hypothetical protein